MNNEKIIERLTDYLQNNVEYYTRKEIADEWENGLKTGMALALDMLEYLKQLWKE